MSVLLGLASFLWHVSIASEINVSHVLIYLSAECTKRVMSQADFLKLAYVRQSQCDRRFSATTLINCLFSLRHPTDQSQCGH